ncbi:hypothetical protein CPB84DRAFT_1745585 [Gymnopilus junonius]|uniref:Uncharacterized protein n=1 Tax=Gymnopilus junonius TaxID=109634 RepID=A0A9P5NQB1_GYMJU|nr:hypothetical protein CPB84DRAFT_1745585 [Gymnopilus junonius]
MASPTPNFVGASLTISWINVLLYMLEITFAIYYFARFKTERLLQFLLFGLLLADTICMITVLASAWLLLIKSFQTYSISETEWTAPLSTFMIAIPAVAEELFLINRCRRLMQSLFVLGILTAMVLTHAVFEIYSGCYVVAFAADNPNARRYGNKGAAVAASIVATVDIFIPLALIWQIHHVTPLQISKQRSWRDTIVNAISSGGCGGIMTVILLVLFWVRTDGGFYMQVLRTPIGIINSENYPVYYVLVNTMGLSKRRSSPYDVPDGVQRKKLSFSANIRLYTFSRPGTSRSQAPGADKQLPPTPGPDEVTTFPCVAPLLPNQIVGQLFANR